MKIYDPGNEFDEEYFEFGLFMSRREYKTINGRLQRGRIASVMEGKYAANQAPSGYQRVKLEHEKGYILEPEPEKADVVRMIFDLYTTGEKQKDGSYQRLGTALIARRLNELNIPTKKAASGFPAVYGTLINPVYIGMIRWNWRPAVKKMADGQIQVQRPRARAEESILTKGRHEGIVAQKIFDAAQENIAKHSARPIGEKNTVKNPLAGLVVCGKCGRRMSPAALSPGTRPTRHPDVHRLL